MSYGFILKNLCQNLCNKPFSISCLPKTKVDASGYKQLNDTLNLVPIGACHGNGRKSGW